MAGAVLLAQGIQRRAAILRFIKSYWKKNHFGPSFDEIAEGVGIGKTSIRHHLIVLQGEGKISLTPGAYRSIRVVE
jgi:SOS-response transcriptional repressor LexA